MIISWPGNISVSVFGGPNIDIDSMDSSCIPIVSEPWVTLSNSPKNVWQVVNPNIYCGPIDDDIINVDDNWIFAKGVLSAEGIITPEGVIPS